MGSRTQSRQIVIPGSWTIATLPAASIYPQFFAWTTDGAAGGCFCLSNGTAWTSVPGLQGAAGATGSQGATGSTGATGAAGAAGVNAIGTPNTRTIAFATAYQATNNAKPALIMVSLTSTSGLTLGGGTTASANIIIGATSAVASGTGTVLGSYSNGLTGALVVGLAINAIQTTPITIPLPTGYFFALIITAGTPAVVSAFDQSIG